MEGTTKARIRAVELRKALPERLLRSRTLKALDDIPHDFWVDDFIPLLVPLGTPLSPHFARAGVERTDSGALIVRKGRQIDLQALEGNLPFIAKNTITPRCGDLIPRPSWGSNLHQLLVNSFWQSLRQQTFAKTGNHCEICGSWNGLECHELWEYHEPTARFAKQGIAGVQRLIELMPLCNRCHETYHFGLAGKKNRSEIVASRIAGYNRYRPDEISEYLAFLIKSWRRRNNYRWVLDLSVLSPLQLSIQERWVTDEDGALTTITERATSNTGLLGIPWRRGEQSFAAIPAEQGYFG